MYARRVLASPARLPLREALKTARVRALLGILGWVVLSCGYMFLYSASFEGHNAFEDWLGSGGIAYFETGIVLIAVFYILYSCTDQMSALVPGLSRGQLDWQLSPLDSAAALLGVLLAALLGAVPLLAGLWLFAAFNPAVVSISDSVLPQFGLRAAAHFSLHLPMYCLASAALMLAARQLKIARLLPWLFSIAGTCALLWRFDPSRLDARLWYTQSQFAAQFSAGPVLLSLLLICILAGLAYICSRQNYGTVSSLLLGILFIWPLALGLGIVATELDEVLSNRQWASNGYSSQGLLSWDAVANRQHFFRYGLGSSAALSYFMLGSFYPSLPADEWDEAYQYFADSDRSGELLQAAQAWKALLAALASGLWAATCILGLNAVRRMRQRRLPLLSAEPLLLRR